jgi:hypothetical protein
LPRIATMEAGFYYPEEVIHVPNPLSRSAEEGDPITAMGYDELYQALYVSVPSQSMDGFHRHRRAHKYHRASLLLALSSPDDDEGSVIPGGGSGSGTMLYSSVAGHPEAPASVLISAYETIYGVSLSSTPSPAASSSAGAAGAPIQSRTAAATRPYHVPSHAYRPPYGTTNPALPAPAPYGTNSNKKPFQVGITSVLPMHGCCATVSLSGVRLHQAGGFMEADARISGMLCGTLHPTHHSQSYQGMDAATASPPTTHITVGGLALESSSSSQQGRRSAAWDRPPRPQHVQCLDVWEGLRPVASYGIADAGRSPKEVRTDVAVTALAGIPNNGTLVAGGTDGTVRLLDSRLREVAKIKSHMGGVVNVAASDDGMLIATTGYGSRGSSSAAATAAWGVVNPLYSFPDPSVLIYDIRYVRRSLRLFGRLCIVPSLCAGLDMIESLKRVFLQVQLGRGGVPHPFAGARGGPRFLSFIPNMEGHPVNRLAVARYEKKNAILVEAERHNLNIVPFFHPQRTGRRRPADYHGVPRNAGESVGFHPAAAGARGQHHLHVPVRGQAGVGDVPRHGAAVPPVGVRR